MTLWNARRDPKPASSHSVIRKSSEGDFQNCSSSFRCTLSHAVLSLTVLANACTPPCLEPASPREAEGKAAMDLPPRPAVVQAQAAGRRVPAVQGRGCVQVRKSDFCSEITHLVAVRFGETSFVSLEFLFSSVSLAGSGQDAGGSYSSSSLRFSDGDTGLSKQPTGLAGVSPSSSHAPSRQSSKPC